MYTKTQITENRQKWLAVLRDPESKKTRGVLESCTDPDARCCLGHACHALGITKTMPLFPGYILYHSESQYLPMHARRALMVSRNGSFKKSIIIDNKELSNIAQVNDMTDLTPQEIADVIEDQFENNNFIEL